MTNAPNNVGGYIRGRGKKKFVKTTDSNHNRRVFPNLITQDFRAYIPNSLWTSDITYIPKKEGWLYWFCCKDIKVTN